jgi:hypothetical protein
VPRGLAPLGPQRFSDQSGVDIRAQILRRQPVHTIKVTIEACGKFARGESGTFLDADTLCPKSALTVRRLVGWPSSVPSNRYERAFCCWSNPKYLTCMSPPRSRANQARHSRMSHAKSLPDQWLVRSRTGPGTEPLGHHPVIHYRRCLPDSVFAGAAGRPLPFAAPNVASLFGAS